MPPDPPPCPEDGCPKLQEVRGVVLGNGHPQDCLLVRVCAIEKSLRTLTRLSWATLGGIGALAVQVIGAWFQARLVG